MVIYVTVALLFSIIIFWMATCKKERASVNLHNGAHRLEIVEGFSDSVEIQNPFLAQPITVSI